MHLLVEHVFIPNLLQLWPLLSSEASSGGALREAGERPGPSVNRLKALMLVGLGRSGLTTLGVRGHHLKQRRVNNRFIKCD